MDLLFTVADDGRTTDVALHAGVDAPVGDAADAVGRHLGFHTSATTFACDRLGGAVDPDVPLGESGLCTGDVVTLAAEDTGRSQPTAVTARAEIRRLVFLEGPMSGHTVVLGRGRHVVGRGSQCGIVVEDPNLSRQHLVLEVDEEVVIEDAGSTNGTWVAGQRLRDPRVLRPGTAVEIGDSILTLVVDGLAAPLEAHAGSVPFNRPPRIEPPYDGRHFELPAPPEDQAKVRFPIVMCIVPLIIAAVMFAIYQQSSDSSFAVISVAFLAMSPVMAVGSYWESRRGNRKDHAEAVAKHQAKVTAIVQELEAEREREADARRRQLPEMGEMFHRARQLSPRLWERGQTDADFLHLRAGTATLPSLSTIAVAAGGSDALRGPLLQIPARYATVADVPLPLTVPTLGGVGVCGPEHLAAGFCRWLVLQAASLHSPADLAIAGLLDADGSDDWAFLKWLPHTRLAASPIRGPHLAASGRDQYDLLARIYDVMNERVEQAMHQHDAIRNGPAVLVVVDGDIALDRAQIHALLEQGPSVGIFFVWLAGDERDLPRPCGAVVALAAKGNLGTAAVRWSASGREIDGIIAESVGARAAVDWARVLAPVVDTSRRSSAAADLPDTVTLLQMMGGESLVTDPAAIVSHWSQGLPLRAPVGMGTEGAFSVDLRIDGPHALIAGTTGAGKSEFLQTWLASLALAHSPQTVNFLLVDYKGGSAFLDCATLPHCVGLVTNLDHHLVHRALISLKAELVFRETVLDRFRAKDMRELERNHPDEALPSLVIVIDEFATLAKEVPEFVDGVVDIARLGRSLGVHLVLATQRPADAISENIRANTNLRVALRVANDGESTDVIGAKDAARIGRDRPGRAYARVGHRELVPFQSAYVGGPVHERDSSAAVHIVDFDGFRDLNRWTGAVTSTGTTGPTELSAIVAAVRAAAIDAAVPSPRVPWMDALPTAVPFDPQQAPGHDGAVTLALADEPQLQRQRPVGIDLEADGSLLVYGASGSGKSASLLSLACAAVAGRTPREINVYALDCASRSLGVLTDLPHCGAVVNVDDHERVERLLQQLRAEIRRRVETFANQHLSSLREWRTDNPASAPPRILVLLDDYAAFTSAYERIDGGELVDLLPRLIAEGRSVGVHFAITADRRGAIPQPVSAAVSRRLVLRMASSEELGNLGLSAQQHVPDAPAGRGYLDGLEVQVASPGHTVADQRALIEQLAATAGPELAPQVESLPEVVDRLRLPAGAPMRPVIGIGYRALEPVNFDLEEAGAIIAGPLRSGRSSALLTIAAGLRGAQPDLACVLVSTRRNPIADADVWSHTAIGEAASGQLLDGLYEQMQVSNPNRSVVLFVDDLTDALETPVDYRLGDLAKLFRDRRDSVVVAVEAQAARRSMFGGVIAELRKDKQGVLLQPDVEVDGDLFGLQLPRRSRQRFGPGRGFLVRRGEIELVQLAR